jgi:hypothetical protein
MEVLRRGAVAFALGLDHGSGALSLHCTAQRLHWFYGFALVLIAVSAAATAAGYLGADRLPPLARLALVFMVPMYYVCTLTGAVRDRIAALGLACGALAGTLAYLIVRRT